MYYWEHFKTITRHRHVVIRHCFKAGIGFQGLFHDLSKYSPAEFLVGAAHYQGDRSPNEGEREDYGYSKAWMHHKGRNRHHFEYWTDYNPKTRLMSPVKMPKRYVAEMFCDRVAAGKIYLGEKYTDRSPLEYFDKGRNTRMIHPETSAQLERLLVMLAEQGEEKTFARLRAWVRGKGKA
ncbi:MAG: catalase [Lachnospiraceae bacterium]|nr:catalase [Lachnospiraceae bacterium]